MSSHHPLFYLPLSPQLGCFYSNKRICSRLCHTFLLSPCLLLACFPLCSLSLIAGSWLSPILGGVACLFLLSVGHKMEEGGLFCIVECALVLMLFQQVEDFAFLPVWSFFTQSAFTAWSDNHSERCRAPVSIQSHYNHTCKPALLSLPITMNNKVRNTHREREGFRERVKAVTIRHTVYAVLDVVLSRRDTERKRFLEAMLVPSQLPYKIR